MINKRKIFGIYSDAPKIIYKQQAACRLALLNYKVNKVRSLCKNSLIILIKQWKEKNPQFF